MKPVFSSLLILLFLSTTSSAQQILVPAKNVFQTKWIKESSYTMVWYGMRDTMKMEIGEVRTQISFDKKNIIVITTVAMKSIKAPWIDSAIAIRKTMAPVQHTSSNMQRDMVLNFNKIVTGNYLDKMKKVNHVISDTTDMPYFDSNLYPTLITWLPLTDGYAKDLSIYDYNPMGKKGVVKAHIKNVQSGSYQSSKSGERKVWIVTVNDDLGSNDKDFITYHIDKQTRQLWKQEINAQGRKMVMVRKEL